MYVCTYKLEVEEYEEGEYTMMTIFSNSGCHVIDLFLFIVRCCLIRLLNFRLVEGIHEKEPSYTIERSPPLNIRWSAKFIRWGTHNILTGWLHPREYQKEIDSHLPVSIPLIHWNIRGLWGFRVSVRSVSGEEDSYVFHPTLPAFNG
ncbi:MAG: hypothetical protein QHG99_08880 [Methanomicrobiales archaeon]|nr:hypothetical protein [Methanomicrobiales archaeon]